MGTASALVHNDVNQEKLHHPGKVEGMGCVTGAAKESWGDAVPSTRLPMHHEKTKDGV